MKLHRQWSRHARIVGVEAVAYLLTTVVRTVGLLVVSFVLAPSGVDQTLRAAQVVGAVVGVVVALAALERHRSPDRLAVLSLGAAALAALSTVVTGLLDPAASSGPTLAGAVLVAAAARRCHPRVAVLVAALTAVTFAAEATLRGRWFAGGVVAALSGFGGGVPLPTVLTGLFLVTALLVGLLLRSRDDAARVDALARVRVSERHTVARELHDLVARHVTGMVVRVQALAAVEPNLGTTTRQAVDEVEVAGGDALEAMRRMVSVLRSPRDDHRGTPLPELDDTIGSVDDVRSVLEVACDGVGGPEGPQVTLDVDPAVLDLASLPRDLLVTVHRVVSEGLTNVARHAPDATRVSVGARRTGDDLVVELRDDGRGGGPRRALRPGGYGLVGLDERVRAVGGTLVSGPHEVRGWCVRVQLPLTSAAARP